MTTSTMGALRELQRLDGKIDRRRLAIEAFDPALAEVEDPALRLESELEALTRRLDQMREDNRRLHRGLEEKRERTVRLEERLNQVQNIREEAAVKAELEMLRRALEADERDQIQLSEQMGRAEALQGELTTQSAEARAQVLPRQADLLARRETLRGEIAALNGEREGVLAGLGGAERRVYESFHAAGRRVIVATLTDDGACGLCFNVVPLQLQNEVRRGSATLLRCEACGVVLTAEPEPEVEAEEALGPPAIPSFDEVEEESAASDGADEA
jgi:uncharacterized protein